MRVAILAFALCGFASAAPAFAQQGQQNPTAPPTVQRDPPSVNHRESRSELPKVLYKGQGGFKCARLVSSRSLS